LNEALKIQKESKKKIGEILVELGYLSPRDLIWLLSEQASIPFIELKPEVLDAQLIRSFPEKLLYEHCIIPLYEIEGKLYVATGNPNDIEGIEKIKEIARKEVYACGAEPDKIFQLLDRFFLAEQAESILTEESFKGDVNIYFTDSGPVVEFIDENNRIKKYKIIGDITIKWASMGKRK